MDLNTRKEDLKYKLKLLKREAASTTEVVNLLVESCEKLVDNLCDDRTNFLLRYPSVVIDLDTRLHNLLQFNCSLVVDLNTSNETARTSEHILEVRSTPGPSSTLKQTAELCHVPRGLDKGVIDECEQASKLCQQSLASLKPNPVSARSPDSALGLGLLVLEGFNNSSLNKTSDIIESDDVIQTDDLDCGLQECSRPPFQSRSESIRPTNEVGKVLMTNMAVVENEDCTILAKEQPNSAAISCENSESNDMSVVTIKKTRFRSTASTKNHVFLESVNRPVHVEDECAVMLSYIETPGDFYVHIACKENSSLDKFHEDLNTFYNTHKVTLKSKTIAKNRIGHFCACFQPEIGWFRAQILNWDIEEEYIEAQLVDFGDVCYVTLEMVQPLLPRFFQQPLYATRCHLAFIQPPSRNEPWPLESAKVFKCYMPTTNKIQLNQSSSIDNVPKVYIITKAEKENLVLSVNGESNLAHQTSLSVILSDSSDPKKMTMNDNLVDLGYAGIPQDDSCVQNDKHFNQITEVSNRMRDVKEWLSNYSYTHSRPILDSNAEQQCLIKNVAPSNSRDNATLTNCGDDLFQNWNPMQEDFLDPSESRENAVLAISGYDAQDEKRICRFYAMNGRCFKGNNCRKEHSFMHKDGYTTDKELINTVTFYHLCMPAEGSNICIKVTHVPEAQKFFYCTIEPDTQCSQAVVEEETLLTITEHMNNPKVVKTFAHLKVPPAPGQIVLALSNANKLWYRARVVEENQSYLDDDVIKVIFVDSGITETVSENNIRAILPSLLHFPFQAIESFVANVEFDKHDSLTWANYFRDLYLHKILTAKVIASFEDPSCLYCLLSDMSGRDIGNLLIDAGFGSQKINNSRLRLIPA